MIVNPELIRLIRSKMRVKTMVGRGAIIFLLLGAIQSLMYYSTVETRTPVDDMWGYFFFVVAGIQLGIVGPASLAENTQKFIHKSEGLAIPQGWDNQLSNEIGMALTYKRGSLRRFGHASSGAIDHDLALYFVSAVGNVLTHVGGGARWRSGVGLVSDPTSMALGWHLFTELETRAVVRNIFLDGNSWSESHSVRKRPLVGHFAAGFEYRGARFGLRIASIIQSEEFDGQLQPHEYASVTFFYQP